MQQTEESKSSTMDQNRLYQFLYDPKITMSDGSATERDMDAPTEAIKESDDEYDVEVVNSSTPSSNREASNSDNDDDACEEIE